jgi:predicted TPR repeat methyltransferase
MDIALPGVAEVEAAVAHWRAHEPRFAALLERYGDAPRALRHFGLLTWDQGQPAEAARLFTGALALAPHDARVWCDLSGALNAAGQLREACACMEESLLRDKTQATSWLRLGTLRSLLDDIDGAELALKAALALEPGLGDARLSLGLLYFGAKRFEEAARLLRESLAAESKTNPAIWACHGQALGHVGDFAGAAAALAIAAALDPGNAVVAVKRAQARFIADLVAGARVEDALAACRADPALTEADVAGISRQGFHLLNAHGHGAAALRLGEARLAEAPEDPERAYLLAILKGETIRAAPIDYVVAHYDQFAPQFDKQLTGVLGYKAFAPLAAMVEARAGTLARVLDLGCGTGLAGTVLAKPGRHLTGVDLSPGMLAKARERGCHDTLVTAEAVAFLREATEPYDLVFASDLVIYVGDLADLMAGVANALVPGGLFALTIETNVGADVALMPSGRFAHALDYVLRVGRDNGMDPVETRSISLRYETKGYVAGDLVLLRRA